LKITHISTSDTNGGAAIAAKRICSSQRQIGLDSKLLVQNNNCMDGNVFSTQNTFLNQLFSLFRTAEDEIAIRLFTNQTRGRFTFPFFGTDISKHQAIAEADIINFHWINGGFLSLNSINKLAQLNKPIVWTLHDMWAFTGGCHYNVDCKKYLTECKNCPSLKFQSATDFSNKIFKQKIDLFSKMNLNIVTCSKWLADEAKKSFLFKEKNIVSIPNPIDTELYKPFDKNEARKNFNLLSDELVFVAGAMNLKDERKGFTYLIDAINILVNQNKLDKDKTTLFIFGRIDENIVSKIPIKVFQTGRITNTDEIVKAYNCANLYLAPSLQDNLPNTVIEALACAIPVVAFNTGGLPDMVDHLQNGYLAQLKSSSDLANGIYYCIKDKENTQKLSDNARKKVLSSFTPEKVANMYKGFYESL